MSAYIEVVSPLAIAAETTAYIHQRASVVAAQIGLRIVEVNERRYQPSALRPSEVVEKVYPDTDARVVVMVSHAGVDEHNTIELQTAHGDTKPDRILKGRFKATIAITPRQADFTTVIGKLAGASSYEIKNGKYIDVR
jgi:hypothetical protein